MQSYIKYAEYLRARLPYGAITEISKNLRVSRVTVYRYLSGKKYNKTVEEAVIKYVELNEDSTRNSLKALGYRGDHDFLKKVQDLKNPAIYSRFLKGLLPYGSIVEIAKITGYNRITVANYLNGKTYNTTIEAAVIEYIKALQAKTAEFLKEFGYKG